MNDPNKMCYSYHVTIKWRKNLNVLTVFTYDNEDVK